MTKTAPLPAAPTAEDFDALDVLMTEAQALAQVLTERPGADATTATLVLMLRSKLDELAEAQDAMRRTVPA